MKKTATPRNKAKAKSPALPKRKATEKPEAEQKAKASAKAKAPKKVKRESTKDEAKVLDLNKARKLKKAAADYVEARLEHERLTKEKTEAQKAMDAAEAKLVTAMNEQGADFVGLPKLGKFKLQPKMYVGAVAANKPAFLKWLRKKKHGGIIKEDVHPQTLKSFVKELMDDAFLKGKDVELKEELTEKNNFITMYEKVEVTWTRPKQ